MYLRSPSWIRRYGFVISRFVPFLLIYQRHQWRIVELFAQIIEKDPLQPNGPPQTTLVEIGPRFVLTPIRIFEGAFGGPTVFSNPGQWRPIVL